MLKKILLLSAFISISSALYSQCAIEPWSLERRFDLSSMVIEGKVIDQYPFRETNKNLIYTASVIEVYKVFKGQLTQPYIIEVLTFGGQIGLEKHRADPELELEPGEMGVFLLSANSIPLPDFVKTNGKSKYQGTASVQSFIKYDLDENKAYDISSLFIGIDTRLYETLQILAGKPFKDIKSNGYNPERLKYKPLSSPVITSFGSNSANAGTGDLLTINGQGFGNSRGNGRIEFVDANFGDGRRVKTPFAADYTVWNDTQIKVRIPPRAGSGNIKVATNDSSSFISINNFTINYAHLNATFTPTGGKEQFFPTDHINDNGKGGYTFQFNHRFKARSGMVNSFLRSLESWRCGTLMNWELGRDTSINTIKGDQVNIVKLSKFGDSRLAVCYSFWNGCYTSGSNMDWYVVELDIEADSSINWYLGNGNMGSAQYDFQSVLTHELGHGHQLGHVNASSEIMHYSISNGVKKFTLSNRDINGGLYVKNKSVNINVCAGNALKALTTNTCGYTVPDAGFMASNTLGCMNTPLTFTDTSKGAVKTYLWNFGTDANIATSTTKGPHQVSYSSAGVKTITLIVANDFGSDTVKKTNYLNVLPLKPATPANLKYSDTGCLAVTTLSVDSVANPNTLVWQLPAQAFVISTTVNSKTISWTSAGGPYTFHVKSMNQCGSSDSIIGKVTVLNNPTASFTAVENGRTVTFTNASNFATSYKWIFGDGDSSILANPVHIYPMKKTYKATLTSINKCKTASSFKDVNPFHPVSITPINMSSGLVYPNPTQNILYFTKGITAYKLFDAMGKLVKAGTEMSVDMTEHSKGMYFLNILLENDSQYSIKVIRN